MTTAVTVGRGACLHRLHFAILRKIHNFVCSFRRLFLRNSISHFALYQHPPPKGTAMKNQKLTPAALRGKQFRWAMQESVWQEIAVCFVSVLFFVVFYAVIYYLLY